MKLEGETLFLFFLEGETLFSFFVCMPPISVAANSFEHRSAIAVQPDPRLRTGALMSELQERQPASGELLGHVQSHAKGTHRS